jgi:hypothetical protein
MKKFIVFLVVTIVAVTTFTYCTQNQVEVNENLNSKLSLIAPNGYKIAKSITVLEKWAEKIAQEKFMTTLKCEIKEIKYFDVKDKYVAQVDYQISDGQMSSFLISNMPFNFDATIVEYHDDLKTRDDGDTYTVTCSGGTCCTPSFHLSSGTASCPCLNADRTINPNISCTMNIKLNQQ